MRDHVEDDSPTLDPLDELVARMDVECRSNRPFDGDLTAGSDTLRHGARTILEAGWHLKRR
jgi:hypothetical protein